MNTFIISHLSEFSIIQQLIFSNSHVPSQFSLQRIYFSVELFRHLYLHIFHFMNTTTLAKFLTHTVVVASYQFTIDFSFASRIGICFSLIT